MISSEKLTKSTSLLAGGVLIILILNDLSSKIKHKIVLSMLTADKRLTKVRSRVLIVAEI